MNNTKGVVNIKFLIYLLLGIVLVDAVIPLLDGLVTLLLTIIEAAKGYFSVKIGRYNATLTKIQNQTTPTESNTKVLGFAIPEEDEEEELEEDDEEDV